jgi:hypothetical protein
MRLYNSASDYYIILNSQREAGEMSLAKACIALRAAGIRWPVLNPLFGQATQDANEIDADILRAGRELGYCK